jgi:hypothetical protein
VAVEADDYYDGDALAPAPKRKRLQNTKLFIGFGFLALAFAGSTIAANISLSSGNIEFGQAVYQIRACDQYVRITPEAGSLEEDELEKVKRIVISGLDALNCRGSEIRINLFSSDSNITPLPLFIGDDTKNLDRVLLNVSTNLSTTRANAVRFVTGERCADQSLSSCRPRIIATRILSDGSGFGSDSFQALSYTPSNGFYTVEFTSPLALVESVTGITIQSSTP